MGREIKFRVRDNSTKELLGYEYFNTCFNTGFFYTNLSELKEGEHEGDLICHSDFHDPPMIRPKKLNQLLREEFIGIKDNNDKEVYEGDKIEIHWLMGDSTVEIISYDENYGYWKYGNNPICELFDPKVIFEVIGNIHENPELCKQS